MCPNGAVDQVVTLMNLLRADDGAGRQCRPDQGAGGDLCRVCEPTEEAGVDGEEV